MRSITARPARPGRGLRRLAAVLALSAAAPAVFADTPPAAGVIVVWKASVDPLKRDAAPLKAAEASRDRKRWERAALAARDLGKRVAKEAGLPPGQWREAGNASALRFDRPQAGAELDATLRRLRLHPMVASVEPDVRLKRQQVIPPPNDTLFNTQWHLGSAFTASMRMPDAWLRMPASPSPVTIAVVDSGVRFDHPDLLRVAQGGVLLNGYDFISDAPYDNDATPGRDSDASDPGDWVTPAETLTPAFAGCDDGPSSWHGTFIAGQIAARTNNGAGVAGLSWGGNAQVLPVRVGGKCGALVSDLLDGVRWAAGLPVVGVPNNTNPAKVINLSFGGSGACSATYQGTVDAVTNAGSLLVVAAGNSDTALTRPADCRGVMAVAAVRRDGAKAYYSSWGSNVALAAPGGSALESPQTDHLLRSTDNPGGTTPVAYTGLPDSQAYGYKQGTSFSAPQAAGVAGLMLAINPSLTPAALIDRMKAAATPWTGIAAGLPACGAASIGACRCTTTTCGAGLLNPDAALAAASGQSAVIQPVGTVLPGATIALDGRASQDAGQPITYQWSVRSGPALTIPNATSALTSVTLPAIEARWEFQLTLGSGATDVIAVVTDAPDPTPVAGGGGGGGLGLAAGVALWAWVLAVITVVRRRRALA